MSYIEETKQVGPFKIEVWVDDFPSNPFEDWDATATIVHWHPRYSLGDQVSIPGSPEEMEELIESVKRDYGATVVLPLYLYDHSGITVSTKPFSCQWDSGQVGLVFMSAKAIKDGWGDHPHPTDEDLPDIIASSLNSFDRYIRGEVYGYSVTRENGDEQDGPVGGFYCDPDEVMKEAESYLPEDEVEAWEKLEALKAKYPSLVNVRVC